LFIADNEELEQISISSSWSILSCDGEIIFRTGRKLEIFGISSVSVGTQIIPIYSDSAIQPVQINGLVTA